MTVLAVAVEAVPFLLIGSVISAVIDLYVSEEAIARIIPAKAVTGVLAASVLGVVLPVCDCATVPIVRRLVAKGVPLHVAITFMLAVLMINPLVVFSTWFAFYPYPRFLRYRMGFGLASAIAVGLLMSLLDGTRQLRVERALVSPRMTVFVVVGFVTLVLFVVRGVGLVSRAPASPLKSGFILFLAPFVFVPFTLNPNRSC